MSRIVGGTRLSRRSLLRGLVGAAALVPLAGLFDERRVRAAAQKRALFVHVPDGCIPALWHPTGSEASCTLPEMSAPLMAIRDQLVFVDGLTMYAGGRTHEGGIAKVLTGVSAQSRDVFLGDRISASRPFRSLQRGVQTTFQNCSGSMSFLGEGQPVTPDGDPNVYKRVFGGSTSGDESDLLLRQNMSVFYASLAELSALQSRLGTAEKQKLDVHLAPLREVEARLSGPARVVLASICGALPSRPRSIIPRPTPTKSSCVWWASYRWISPCSRSPVAPPTWPR